MSLATAQPGSPARSGRFALGEGVARPGLALSGMLHLVMIVLLIFGLPTLFSPPVPQEMPIAVDLVNLGPETRATRPNPRAPQPEARPVAAVPGPNAEKPPPKPQPPQSMVPPSAAAAPNPEPLVPPEAKPEPPPLPQAKPVPPPNPVAEVVPPRPSEKPLPPRVRAATAARAEARKYDPGQFDALLRNLATANNAASSEATPRRSPAATGRPSSQPQAPLGRLSASELDMVREQISRCWNVPAGARDARDLVVVIRVAVSPDGNVEAATIVDQGRAAGDPFFRAAAESARRAFFNPLCRPLRLPPDKYQIWRDMVVDFSPRDLS
jgi:outer membrane biosynthesis protein TonB